jgi:hypothetical protein
MANGFNLEMSKISELDKKFRMVIGGVLIAGVVLGLNNLFFLLVGCLLVASGYVGKCALLKFLNK